MNRFLVLIAVAFLVIAPVARADGPDDQYVNIYNLIQQADSLNDRGQPAQALAKYLDAQTALQRFQDGYPTWNVKVVKFRLRYLAARVAQVSMTLPPPSVATNSPDAAVTNSPPGSPYISPASANAPPTPAPKDSGATVNAPATPTVPPKEAPAVVAAPAPERREAPQPSAPNTVLPAQASQSDEQVRSLQDQVQRLTADRDLLQAKLKEALTAQPPGIDPRELSSAQNHVRELQKENDLLKVTLDESRNAISTRNAADLDQARKDLADANLKIVELTQANADLATERDALRAHAKASIASDETTAALRTENAVLKKEVTELRTKPSTGSQSADLSRRLLEAQAQIAALESDKQMLALEKTALESRVRTIASSTPPAAPLPAAPPSALPVDAAATDARIKQLEAERDGLQRKLAAATADAAGRKSGAEAAEIGRLTHELAALRARVEVFESRPVPYSTEELALFSLPANSLVASAHNLGGNPGARPSVDSLRLTALAEGYYSAHELDKAEQSYLDLLKANGKNLVVLGNLATVEIDLNRLDKAEQYIKTALSIDSHDAYSMTVFGRLRLQQGKTDEAMDILSQAAQLDPQNPEIQNYLGIALSHKGLRGPAETALRKAVQLNPNFASAHNNLAVVYATQKPPLIELARWHYQKALAAGQPRNVSLEKLLDAPKTASITH